MKMILQQRVLAHAQSKKNLIGKETSNDKRIFNAALAIMQNSDATSFQLIADSCAFIDLFRFKYLIGNRWTVRYFNYIKAMTCCLVTVVAGIGK